jgi:hypothetical protein
MTSCDDENSSARSSAPMQRRNAPLARCRRTPDLRPGESQRDRPQAGRNIKLDDAVDAGALGEISAALRHIFRPTDCPIGAARAIAAWRHY